MMKIGQALKLAMSNTQYLEKIAMIMIPLTQGQIRAPWFKIDDETRQKLVDRAKPMPVRHSLIGGAVGVATGATIGSRLGWRGALIGGTSLGLLGGALGYAGGKHQQGFASKSKYYSPYQRTPIGVGFASSKESVNRAAAKLIENIKRNDLKGFSGISFSKQISDE